MTTPDASSLDRLGEVIAELLPALEEFNRFEGPDRAVPRSAWLPLVSEHLPEEGSGLDTVVGLLRDIVVARGSRIGHPGFSGWVTTAPTTSAAAADLAQTIASPQRWWVHPGNHIDSMAVEWMIELLGFPASHVGQFTSGGSTANLIGLGAARQHAGERLGIDAARYGVGALPHPVVYASRQTHHVVGRAVGALGLGRSSVRQISLGADGRIDVGSLEKSLDADVRAGMTPVAIVGNGGDVNTGLVDPLPQLSQLAQDRGIWFHVDGAYGGFGLLDERVRDRFGDPATYDSFAIDPHKWMAAPIGTGLIICRDGDLLGRSFTVETGGYDRERDEKLGIDTDPASPWESVGLGTPDWGVDFSTPARGIAVWAILKEIGARGMRERVSRHLDCARLVADRARIEPDLELLLEPELSICCYRYVAPGLSAQETDALNQRILAELRIRGDHLPSSTLVDGRFALRPCFINPRTGLAEAEGLVEATLEIGRNLAGD